MTQNADTTLQIVMTPEEDEYYRGMDAAMLEPCPYCRVMMEPFSGCQSSGQADNCRLYDD